MEKVGLSRMWRTNAAIVSLCLSWRRSVLLHCTNVDTLAD